MKCKGNHLSSIIFILRVLLLFGIAVSGEKGNYSGHLVFFRISPIMEDAP